MLLLISCGLDSFAYNYMNLKQTGLKTDNDRVDEKAQIGFDRYGGFGGIFILRLCMYADGAILSR